ncbi:MAG TPA: hypothetical protein VLK34_03975, partial [Nocardioidaceae bacterium]|nr:hypothetical protein [Nocardioidaceae bacterium]
GRPPGDDSQWAPKRERGEVAKHQVLQTAVIEMLRRYECLPARRIARERDFSPPSHGGGRAFSLARAA